MTFEKACWDAAAEFLQTVVLVDDRAAFSEPKSGDELGEEVIIEPSDMDSAPAVDTQALRVLHGGGEDLDAGIITKGFADQGLICAVLKPTPGSALTDETLSIAQRADIVVLDWEMMDHGEKATTTIQRLIAADILKGGRLRLVVIYTGLVPLTPIVEQIEANAPPLTRVGTTLTLRNPLSTMKVVVLGKGGSLLAGDEKPYGVEAVDLPQRLIREFAEFAGGLLPNATLASMGHLRANTHKMLARFNKAMDAPLITHHALMGKSADSEQYVADLIMEELEAQIPLTNISSRYAGSSGILEYLEHQREAGQQQHLSFDIGGVRRDTPVSADSAGEIVVKGTKAFPSMVTALTTALGASKTIVQENLKKPAHRFYSFVEQDHAVSLASHEKFAVLSSIRRSMSEMDLTAEETFPTLKLGAIVHDGSHYFICVTPVCDSVRLEGDRSAFTFARLEEHDKEFSLVVVDGQTKRLSIDRKKIRFHTFELKPSVSEDVRAVLGADDTSLYFQAADAAEGTAKDPDLRWVAEMKPLQAQRVVSSLTSHLSRIGLDEFEWQRLQAPKWS